jgi:branched-chain amino acid transport system substrate-binding protein
MTITRRTALAAAATATLAAAVRRAPAAAPIRLGFLTVKTGPLASGGIQMEQGLTLFLKQQGNMLAGRPVQLFTEDTGGIPANALTKTQALVERDKVQAIIGPLAAFELLAIVAYTEKRKMPVLSVAAAENISQRTPDPWFIRCTSSSAQASQPMGYYAAKTLGYKKMTLIADDITYGYEQNAGFMRVFEDNGGKVIQRLWPPLNAPDYGTYIAEIRRDADAVFMAFAGANGFRFTQQYFQYGLGGRKPIIGGMTALDDSILPQIGTIALGLLSTCFYAPTLNYPSNRAFVAAMRKTYHADPGYYSAGTYVTGQVLAAALEKIGGKIEDAALLMHTLRTNEVAETARGPVKFDAFGNVVGNVYIRKVVRQGPWLVNDVVYTFPDVSQFWTYDPAAFLKEPVYSKTWPPARFIEK